jgi:hypothetical protein
MNIKDEIKKLSDKERLSVAILSGWTILHLILLLISEGSTKYFWPFDEEPRLKSDYDFSEFAVYGLVPWAVFLIFWFLKNTNTDKNEH